MTARTFVSARSVSTPNASVPGVNTRSVLTGDSLISFVSAVSTSVGRETFYNLKDEQRQALLAQHQPVFEHARPFYALMSLAKGATDVSRQIVAHNLVLHKFREAGLKDHEHSPMTKWENEILFQVLDNIPPPRVFDLFLDLIKSKGRGRARFVMLEWLRRHKNSWNLWAIKYRKDFKPVLRHCHTNGDKDLLKVWRYLKYGEAVGLGGCIEDYEAVRAGDKDKLARLPHSVAEGFITKFKISKEDFDKLFASKGGKLTAKETRLHADSMKKSGVDSGFDPKKAELLDLLTYWHQNQDFTKRQLNEARLILSQKAAAVAKGLRFGLKKVGLVFDNSLSMYGSKETPFHPMLKALAISLVLKAASDGFKMYYTNPLPEQGLFPQLGDQSNYADSVLKALEDGCETIVLVGDGYENAPYKGAAHQLVYSYKKKVDRDNKTLFLHFNPVYGAESQDVRQVTDLAPAAGVRALAGLNEAMFLAIGKAKPLIAIQKYVGYLAGLQNDRAKALMPAAVKEMIEGGDTEKLFIVNQTHS